MTISPSSSTMVRSSRVVGLSADTGSEPPGQQPGGPEFGEDPVDVLDHYVPVHPAQLHDGRDHLLYGGLAVAQVPDGLGGLVQEENRSRGAVVDGILPLGL